MESSNIPGRSRFTRRHVLGLAASGAIGSVANAFWIEPARLSVTRKDMVCGKLPAALDGLRVGLIADIHFRPEDDAELLEKLVEQVRREKLDLIALAGDYMGDDPRVISPMLERLGNLQATYGVFAVMGNHDGWSGSREALRRQFEKAGISFLINRHSVLTIAGESLAMAGSDFVWLGRPDPAAMLRGLPLKTPVLAMVHEPDYFDHLTAHREILLQVSGHTHGGQCRVPMIDYAPRRVSYGRKYLEGAYRRGESSIFVTRGVGTTGVRVRFACPPELAVLTLRAPSAVTA